jgi:hypothetical protein
MLSKHIENAHNLTNNGAFEQLSKAVENTILLPLPFEEVTHKD